jgi:hypothetical protein
VVRWATQRPVPRLALRGRARLFILLTAAFLVLAVDRYLWAGVAQWREDQATNLWLGYSRHVTDLPVGLISSTAIPNPNGMMLVGSILGLLPSLITISFALSLSQAVSIILVGWKVFKGRLSYVLLATVPALTSVILRSGSVELWNNYILTTVDMLFVFFALRYLERPSLLNIPPIVLLVVLAPSLYLAGLVNAIVMVLITVGLLLHRKPDRSRLVVATISSGAIAAVSLVLTWIPFARSVSVHQLTGANETTLRGVDRVEAAVNAVWQLPSYGSFQWSNRTTFAAAFLHSDPRILSPVSVRSLDLVGILYMLEGVFAVTVIGAVAVVALRRRSSAATPPPRLEVDAQTRRLVMLGLTFIVLSYLISPLLGGPALAYNQRLDQSVQFLPLFLMSIFLVPLAVAPSSTWLRRVTSVVVISAMVFSVVNFASGLLIVRDHQNYRGAVLSSADVPLTDELDVVEFIAADWKRHSSSDTVAVDYRLGGGKWDWVPSFGQALTRWYPAPMTLGRSFDFELRRRFGLTNQQEGVQLRTFGTGRYLVTYAFEPSPRVSEMTVTDRYFGRLRVSISVGRSG